MKDDNAVATVLPARKPLTLLVCTPTDGVRLASDGGGGLASAGVNPYLEAVVAAFGAKVKATWAKPPEIQTAVAGGYDVAVVNASDVLPQASREALKNYVKGGATLVLFPGDGDAKSLGELAGVSTEGWEASGGVGDYRLVSYTATDAALPSLDDFGGSLLGYPRAFRYLRVADGPAPATTDAEAAHILVRLDNGRPFLVERKYGAGTVYLFAVPLNPKASDLVLRAGFPPFLYQLLVQGVDRRRPKASFVVGDYSA